MRNTDFAVFILTHGRPDNVKTTASLKRCGYTGRIFYIVDNEDKSVDKYKKNFGAENVIVFDKKAEYDKVDKANNFENHNIVLYARNVCFRIARDLGITYFMQLDDDYNSFLYRNEKHGVTIKNIDVIFDALLDYYKSTNMKSIAFSQGGDHIGGFGGTKLKRKCMNSFICSVDREFQFMGSINEDVNAYVTLGSRGDLFFTITNLQLNQAQTQKQAGGLTEAYLFQGTYLKSFYTVMMHPSSVKISMMGRYAMRLHHHIKWSNTVPVIIDEKYKK